MGIHWQDGYSSNVDLTLVIDGKQYRVSQVGPEAFILNEPMALPPCFADLRIRVDNKIENFRIALYEGSSMDSPVVRYEDIPTKLSRYQPANGVK